MKQRVYASCMLGLAVLLLCIDFVLACLVAYAGTATLLSASSIAGRRRVFWQWVLGLSTVWLLLNAPRDLGSLKRFLGVRVGFPWTFAHWGGERLQAFDPVALVGDVALGAVVVFGLAGLCAVSRRAATTDAPNHDVGATRSR